MATIRSAEVCGHCWMSHGTFRKAGDGTLVHEQCLSIYNLTHGYEPSAKQNRKAKREARRASRRAHEY